MAGTWYGTSYSGDGTNETVKGTSADESIRGEDGQDTLSGGGGNDWIEGGSGSDTLRGGTGDDVLIGFSSYGRDFLGGLDRLYGDSGNDTLLLTAPLAAGFSLDGGAGERDTAKITFGSYQGSVTTQPITFTLNVKGSVLKVGDVEAVSVKNVERIDFTGDAGADRITGGALDDIITGREGEDVLKGLGGDDLLDGGTGKQDIDGGTGFDTASFDLSAATDALVVKTGTKVLLGAYGTLRSIEKFGIIRTGSGADTVLMGEHGGTAYGGGGADTMTGGKGADTLNGGAGADTLNGGAGNDSLDADYDPSAGAFAPAANDVLDGGKGDDGLWGGNGSDTLSGGEGNDSVGWTSQNGVDTAVDTFDGGEGSDTFSVSLYQVAVTTAEVALKPTGKTLLKLNGTTVAEAKSVEDLSFSEYGSANVTLTGAEGDDYVFTSRGNSVIKTFGGKDSVSAGSGSDIVDTGDGNDNASATVDGKDSIKTGAGNDTLTVDASSLSAGSAFEPSVYDMGSGSGDILTLMEAQTTDFSFDGTNIKLGATQVARVLNYEFLTFHGSDITSTFAGTDHDDTIYMGWGDDTANGGKGDDKVYGGYGKDTLNGGAGNDFVSGGAADNDTLDGGSGTDTVDFSDWGASGLKITLKGKTKSTVALGQYEKDTFVNFESANGSMAGDTIKGDGGANVLNGMAGSDELWGKGGKDTFVFSTFLDAKNNVDVIKDFSDDTIKLEGSNFGKLATTGKDSHLAAAAFKDLGDKGAKLDATDRILYDHGSGKLWFDADGSGKTTAVQFAQLEEGKNGFADLSPADFVVKYIEPIFS
jgi:trimeric autotransporter adhesin